jgi:O-antigen/teichoic acid export membrane protein
MPPAEELPRRPRFAVAALTTYGTSIGVAAISLANVLVTARALGPEGRGEIALLTTIVVLTSNVALLGVEAANVNFASRDSSLRGALAANSVVLALSLGGIAAGIVVGIGAVFPGLAGDTDPGHRWLAVGAIPAFVLQTYFHFLIQADYRFGFLSVTRLVAPVSSVTVNSVLAGIGSLTVTSAFVTWLAGHGLALLLLGWFVLARGNGFSAPDVGLARRSLGFGLKSHPGRIMNLANYRLDQWIVGTVAGSRELGLYSIAVAWGEALFFMPTALATVQRPDLVRDSARRAAERAARVFRLCMLGTLPLALFLIVAAPFLCATIFGDDFRGSIDDLRILAVGGFGIVALKLLGDALVAQGWPLRTTSAVGVAFLVTVGLDVALIPPLGGLGAAIASTVAYTAGGVTVAALFGKTLDADLRMLMLQRDELGALVRRVHAGLAGRLARRGD